MTKKIMTKKAVPRHDAFTLSLGGLTTIASFVIAPAIADNRINKALDERRKHSQENQPDNARKIKSTWGRFWLRRRRQVA